MGNSGILVKLVFWLLLQYWYLLVFMQCFNLIGQYVAISGANTGTKGVGHIFPYIQFWRFSFVFSFNEIIKDFDYTK